MFEKYLEEIGLSDKEATVYLSLLSVDYASISEIAKKTKINRTTVYPVLQSLQKKGLAHEAQVGKTIHYQAAPPERLETYVERQKVVLEEHASRLKDIIPQIKNITRDIGERPIIMSFIGREGAIAAYEEFYKAQDGSAKEGYFIFNRDIVESLFTERERNKMIEIRKNKGVVPTSVYNKKDGDMVFTTKGMRTRIDAEKYPIYSDVTIIGDTIFASTVGTVLSSVIIKSKDLAVTFASLIRYINDTNNKKGG